MLSKTLLAIRLTSVKSMVVLDGTIFIFFETIVFYSVLHYLIYVPYCFAKIYIYSIYIKYCFFKDNENNTKIIDSNMNMGRYQERKIVVNVQIGCILIFLCRVNRFNLDQDLSAYFSKLAQFISYRFCRIIIFNFLIS